MRPACAAASLEWGPSPARVCVGVVLRRLRGCVSQPFDFHRRGGAAPDAKSCSRQWLAPPAPQDGAGPDQCCAMAEAQTQDRIVGGMAGRYATALFELARDERAMDAVATDLDA